MLSKAAEKRIKSLHTKKGREKSGLCLVEGQKVIDTAGELVDFVFSRKDSDQFDDLVTTETSQDVAAVARIPEWSMDDVNESSTIVVLDGVQDPGNVGAVLRLCLGFDASLLLIDSADVTSSKVIRSSVGAMFQVPWSKISRQDAVKTFTWMHRPVYRLERSSSAGTVKDLRADEKILLIAGSEGSGITLNTDGASIQIDHNDTLESLNVANAVAIALHERFQI